MHYISKSTKFVWIIPTSRFAGLWIPLAFEIKRQTGLVPLFVVPTDEDKQFYQKTANKIGNELHVIVAPAQYVDAIETDQSEWPALSRLASAYEDRFNITINRSFIQSDRHLGRGFIWGWHGYPRSYASENSNDAGRLRAVVNRLDFFCELFESQKPGLVIGCSGLGAGLASGAIWLLCEENKITFRTIASARFGGLYYWAIDPFDNPHQNFFSVFKKYQKLTNNEPKKISRLIKPPTAFEAVKKRPVYPSLARAFKIGIKQFCMRTYHMVRGYSKARYGYKILDASIAPIVDWWHGVFFRRLKLIKLESIAVCPKVVLIPLQVEPEISIHGQSPAASNMLNIIYETALALPANATLLVKEHPLQVGRRPKWFYDIIVKLPNTFVVDPSINSQDLLSHTDVVVQINSSLGYEAAARGIPVLTFSPHGGLSVLDHVSVIRCAEDLNILRHILKEGSQESIDLRKNNGSKFVLALKDHCEDLSWMHEYDNSYAPSPSEMDTLVRSLSKTVDGYFNQS